MNNKIRPEFEAKELGKNPFLKELKIPVNKITLAGQFKKDKDGVYLPVEQELEREPVCRVYVTAERRKDMVALASRTKDLLLWLMYEAESGMEYIWINKNRYMKESKISSVNTYKAAIKELHMNNFILPSVVRDVYWINPSYFFNGSRINKFPENVVRR